jgi:D-arabinose 1-dehydrogenase-like Zn-dependent alcohol dehydrogenase
MRALRPSATAVVIGAGGLGHIGVQIVTSITGAAVVAVDTRAKALACALTCGADYTVETRTPPIRSGPSPAATARTW